MLNDPARLLSMFLGGAAGTRGRKRARRAARFIGGNRGFLSASTLLAAAGVAWGIYDQMKGTGATGASGATGATGAVPQVRRVPQVPQVHQAHQAHQVPPIPVVPGLPSAGMSPASTGTPAPVLQLVRLAVSAARADGTLAPDEREAILRHARAAGLDAVVEASLDQPPPLADIVRGVTEGAQRAELYVLAFTIVRADEGVSGAERIYLAQLAHRLDLDAATVARLERETAAKIDAEPDV